MVIKYSEKTDVTVIGRSCVDYFAVIDRFPEENSKIPLINRIIEGGGQGGTASCCIAALGGKVSYVGLIGDDENGRFCLKRLRETGVSTGLVKKVKGADTPVAYILVNQHTGERTIIYEPSKLPKIVIDSKLKKIINNSKVLLLDPQVTYLAPSIAQSNRNNSNFKIVYDCERYKPGIQDMMKIADFFIPSWEIFTDDKIGIWEKGLRNKLYKLKSIVSGELIVTAGHKGVYYIENDKIHHICPPVVKIKDTTGAGDNFHAAFCFALSRDYDILEAVKFSVTVATLSCREYGGRKGIPSFKETLKVVKDVKVTIE